MNQKELIEKLYQAGVDTNKAISRFMGNEDLFISFIKKLPYCIDFESIRNDLENENEEEFYLKVHNLKGTAGNLGIDTIFDCSQAILVEFRTSKFTQMKKLKGLIKEAELESALLNKIILSYEKQRGNKK